jgi:hypothetical protein
MHDATGKTDRVPTGGRAQFVLDVSGRERSSESGVQHLSLLLAYVDSSLNAEW